MSGEVREQRARSSAFSLRTFSVALLVIVGLASVMHMSQRRIRRAFRTNVLEAGSSGAAQRGAYESAMGDSDSVVLFGTSELTNSGMKNIPVNALPSRMERGSVIAVGHAGMQSLAMAAQIAVAPEEALVVTLIGPGWFVTPMATEKFLEHISNAALSEIVARWKILPPRLRTRLVGFLRGHCSAMQWKNGVYKRFCRDVESQASPSTGTQILAAGRSLRTLFEKESDLAKLTLDPSKAQYARIAASAAEPAPDEECLSKTLIGKPRIDVLRALDEEQKARSAGNAFLVKDDYFNRYLKDKAAPPSELKIPTDKGEEFEDYLALLDTLAARRGPTLVYLSSFNAAVYTNMAAWQPFRNRLRREAHERGLEIIDSWDAIYRPSQFVDPQHISEGAWMNLNDAIVQKLSAKGGC